MWKVLNIKSHLCNMVIDMPYGDCTGPDGRGPRRGRRFLGRIGDFFRGSGNYYNYPENSSGYGGYGRGGYGRGAGGGAGRGQGQGYGRGNGRGKGRRGRGRGGGRY